MKWLKQLGFLGFAGLLACQSNDKAAELAAKEQQLAAREQQLKEETLAAREQAVALREQAAVRAVAAAATVSAAPPEPSAISAAAPPLPPPPQRSNDGTYAADRSGVATFNGVARARVYRAFRKNSSVGTTARTCGAIPAI
jgi:hypothetical protein